MKRRIEAYTFNPTSKVLTLTGEGSFSIDGLLAVINVTVGGDLYLAGQDGFGYASVTGNAVTLEAATSGMNSGDKLLILYDDAAPLAVSGPLTSAQLAAAALATHADAAAILAKLSADPATQTTLAAVLAKLSSDPASQTTLAAILAKLTADPATQTTLAAVLAKLTADPSTGAKQDTAASKLDAILAELQAQLNLAATLWTDNSGAFYVRRDVIDTGAGTVTVSFTDPAGSAATPGAGLRPAANEESLLTEQVRYDVLTTSAPGGYTAGDVLVRSVVMDQNSSPPSVVSSFWLNISTGAVISAPNAAHIAEASRNVVVASSALPAGAATEATLAAQSAKLPASLGGKAAASSLSVTTATDDPLLTVLGEVQATPTANTVLRRLKDLLTQTVLAAGTAIIGKVGIDQTTPGTSNAISRPDGPSVSGSASGTGVLSNMPVTVSTYGAQSFSVQWTAAGSGNVATYEGSNDGSTWFALAGQSSSTIGLSGNITNVFTVSTGTPILCSTLGFAQIRVRISTYVSGTPAATLQFLQAVAPFVAIGTGTTFAVNEKPTSSGGLTPFRVTTGASGAGKSGSAQLYMYDLVNTQASARFMQFYNKTTAGVPGTDTPVFMVPLAANGRSAANPPAGVVIGSTGCSWAITTDAAGATAASSGDVVGSFATN